MRFGSPWWTAAAYSSFPPWSPEADLSFVSNAAADTLLAWSGNDGCYPTVRFYDFNTLNSWGKKYCKQCNQRNLIDIPNA